MGNQAILNRKTVMKVLEEEKKIFLILLGAVSPDDIKKVFDNVSNYKDNKINCITKISKISQVEPLNIKKDKNNPNSLIMNKEEPELFLKHYSPKLETYLFIRYEVKYNLEEMKISDKMLLIDYRGNFYMKI